MLSTNAEVNKATMNKDQTIGATIFAVCAIVAIFYAITLAYPDWLAGIGIQSTSKNIQFWIVAIPVAVGFIGILAIGSWIGWTMATTPPPQAIEEKQTETQQKDAAKETT